MAASQSLNTLHLRRYVCGVFKGVFAHVYMRRSAGDLLILIKGSQRLAVSAQQA